MKKYGSGISVRESRTGQIEHAAGGDQRVNEGHESRHWTFLSNHAHVLICVARQPEMRIRDIAVLVGITERAASSIVADLEAEGYLTRSKVGRNNRYELHLAKPLRHPLEEHRPIGDLIAAIATGPERARLGDVVTVSG
jgi:hypothetical protein